MLPALIGLSLALYFFYHLAYGERSIFQYMDLQSERAALSAERDVLGEKRAELQARVVKMRPDSIDRDMLEERVMATLGYIPEQSYILSR